MDSVIENETQEITQLDLLKQRIEYDELIFGDNETYEKVLNRLLEDSKYIALSLRFPYLDYFEMELPKKYNNWQIRCCVEIYQGIGSEGIKSYSENGLSWTKDSGYISYELRGEIEPMIGYIQEQIEEEEEENVQTGE